jgi:hypothetical protein
MAKDDMEKEGLTWPSIIRKERKCKEFSAAMETGLAAICGVCAAVLTLRGDVFAVFAAAGMTVNALNVRDDLRKARELKAEEAEAREMLISFIIEAHKRFDEREKALSPADAGALPEGEPGGRERREQAPALRMQGRVIHLALHHRKMRVRKKNANRIIREEKRDDGT